LKVKLGLPSNLFANLSLEESIERIAELRPEALEIVLDKPHLTPTDVLKPALKHRLKDAVSILNPEVEKSFHAPFQGVNLSAWGKRRLQSLKVLRESLHLAAELDGRVVVTHPGWASKILHFLPFTRSLALNQALRLLKASLKVLRAEAENLGVKLALENVHGSLSPFKLPGDVGKIGETQVTLDFGHAYIEARRLGFKAGEAERWLAGEVENHLKGKVTHVHLHDSQGLRDSHLPPGEGEIDFKPLVEALKRIDFEGQVILEVWKPDTPASSAIKALNEARRILEI